MELDRAEFAAVVRATPLVSIDLIVRNPAGEILLGLRNNEPARDRWFVPGGRIRKDERIAAAFERLTAEELGAARPVTGARFRGVFEHLYDANFAELPGFGTHYVVLAYELDVEAALEPPKAQHREYRWVRPETLRADDRVHRYTQAYF